MTDAAVFEKMREADLEAGKVEPMLHEEFVRRVRDERGR